MLHQKLVFDEAVPVAADLSVGEEVALLAAGLDARFLHAGSTLERAVAMIDRVIGGLDGIVAALDASTAGAAVADLRHVAERLSALPALQDARSARLHATATIGATLSGHVTDMQRTLHLLGIYGMNIKIAASGQEQFVGFVESMKERLHAGEQQLASVMRKLAELGGGVAEMQRVDRRLAIECARVVPAVPNRLDADAVALSAYLDTVATLARRVAGIARGVQAKVAVVLGALQVGDSTRQRLEHVVTTLRMVADAGAGPGARAHVDRLLAAQLEATREDFARETAALIGSLVALGPDARELLDLIGEHADGSGRDFLARLEQGVSDTEAVTGKLRDAEARARRMTAVVTETVGDLTSRVGNLDRVQLDVQDIATNTRLLARRHGMIGRAVAVVAAEVDIHSRALGRAAQAVRDSIRQLGMAEAESADDTDGRELGAVLDAALGIIRLACQRSEQVATSGGEDARALADLLAAIADELRGDLSLGAEMAAAAATLSARAAGTQDRMAEDDEVLHALLPAIARLYTMSSEREVHDRFLLPDMMPVTSVAVDEEEEDDGLF